MISKLWLQEKIYIHVHVYKNCVIIYIYIYMYKNCINTCIQELCNYIYKCMKQHVHVHV